MASSLCNHRATSDAGTLVGGVVDVEILSSNWSVLPSPN